MFKRNRPYSQIEVAEQIRQISEMIDNKPDIDAAEIEVANEILKFMLEENITWMKGK